MQSQSQKRKIPTDSNQNCLIIFVKKPVEGKVKTRIAATAGDQMALEVYQQLLAIIRKTTAETKNCVRVVCYSDEICPDDEWSNDVFHKKLQKGHDLGERMSNAFTGFAHQFARMVLIGSDCPYISSELLGQAFQLLDFHDIVLGPATDGGYYLIGMKTPHPQLFEGISWSTDLVRRQTEEIIARLNLTVAYTALLSDVDTESDWQDWLNFSQNSNKC